MKPKETIDYHIKVLWHSISNIYNQLAQEFELTQSTGYVLLNIDAKNGTPATSIAPLMGMKSTSLSRVLRNMEEEELIFRKKEKSDKRLVKIHLTAKGEEKKKIAKKVVKEFNEFLIERLSTKELENYFNSIQSINTITEEYKQLKLT
ncbi:MAG: MarR family transcriptional regulator [Vicingaceae bacterium]